MGNLPAAIAMKKSYCSPTSTHKLPIATQQEGKSSEPSPTHAGVLTGLIVCRQPQLLWIHESNRPAMTRRILHTPIHLPELIFFLSFILGCSLSLEDVCAWHLLMQGKSSLLSKCSNMFVLTKKVLCLFKCLFCNEGFIFLLIHRNFASGLWFLDECKKEHACSHCPVG